ncbi:VP11 [Eriocheir sinensis reovirus]|uniref:VP11 n=1 Tax=Eriocheir sinensis reovirus TaxID=273810 RepID=A0A0E3T6N5_ESRV|nr:VP11 [Eriocheir sinensis reovirus]AKC01930.1 VP11 [Eriocheir sinensis reovirus]
MDRSKSINFQSFMMNTRPPTDMISVSNAMIRMGDRANQKWAIDDRLYFAIRKMNPVFVHDNQIPTKYDYSILQIQTRLIATLRETLLFLVFSYYLREYQDKNGVVSFYPVAMKDMRPIVNELKRRVNNSYDMTLNMAYRTSVVNAVSAPDAFDSLAAMLAVTSAELQKTARLCPELLNVFGKMSFIIVSGPERPSIISWKRQL